MGLKVTNNAFGTLNAGINDSATTIVLTAGQGARFPTLSAGDYFYATLIDTSNNLEIVKVTARSTDTMTVVRGQDNTTARAFSTNDRFELRPTAALFNEKANDADVTTALAGKVSLAGDSMTGQLNVHNSTQSNFASTLAESVSRATVKLRTHSTDSTLTTFGGITGGDAYIQRSNGSGTSEYDIRLNPFGGRVLIPNQPAFCVTSPSNGTSNAVQTFTNVLLNKGSHYSTSTGKFTAPVTGTYLFNWHILSNGNQGYHYGYLEKNGNVYVYAQQYNSTGVTTGSTTGGSAIVSLSANDTIGYYHYGGSYTPAYNGNYSVFSGLLLG
jgi:hypothetical protein